MFEETHWWLVQLTQMADRMLDHLFDFRRNYTIDDFSKFYRTNLNVLGQPIDDDVQECAVLSRLLYDLSTAYLITGADRYFLAARAAMKYLREAFRSLSHDGEHCFWAYGRRRNEEGEKGESLYFASQGPDDVGTIPLYEQIYALAGLTQYYRITLDWAVLEDIRRTINSFQDFYWDPPEAKQKGFAGAGGYYSHLDPATMRPDTPTLGENCKKKKLELDRRPHSGIFSQPDPDARSAATRQRAQQFRSSAAPLHRHSRGDVVLDRRQVARSAVRLRE
jgi:hypothetical protein